MADKPEKSQLEDFVGILLDHGVEFIVIGGQAEGLLGSPRVTYDVDLCYRRTTNNLAKLARALKELKPTLRGAPPDLEFHVDANALTLGSNYTFRTSMGDLDLFGYVEPLGTYEDLIKRAEVLPFGDHMISVIGLEDLITIKSHLQRPKDRDSLFQLLAIKRIREETGSR